MNSIKDNDLSKLLLKKLLDISSKLVVKKDNKNDFGGFKYRSLEDIYEVLKPLLKENGCYILFEDKIELVNNRFYYVSECKFYSIDIGTELYISSIGYARETESRSKMDEAQVTGAASSYAKKYAVCSLFLIDEGSDPDKLDNTNTTNNTTNKNTNTNNYNYINNNNKLSNIIKGYYDNKNYEALKNSIISIANEYNEEQKNLLRTLLSNCKKLSYEELKKTHEYKTLIN